MVCGRRREATTLEGGAQHANATAETGFAEASVVGAREPPGTFRKRPNLVPPLSRDTRPSPADGRQQPVTPPDAATANARPRDLLRQSEAQPAPSRQRNAESPSRGWPSSDGGAGAGGPVGECFRFGSDQGMVPMLPRSPPRQPQSAGSVLPFSSATSPSLLSRASTTASGRGSSASGRGAPWGLAAAREEREAVEAEVRQALARAEPNLFPEIFAASTAEGGSEELRGRRGWLAAA